MPSNAYKAPNDSRNEKHEGHGSTAVIPKVSRGEFFGVGEYLDELADKATSVNQKEPKDKTQGGEHYGGKS